MAGYVLELNRWNVKNDGTDAINTSKGINAAIIWASQQGFAEIALPGGIYLIDENNPIQPLSFMTLNLGGSTLRIRDNGLQKYAIVSFQSNQQYSKLTNGKIIGDKDTHDYNTIPGTHEGGYGIEVGSFTPKVGSNIRFLSIDHLEVSNCTGDGIIFASTFGQISPVPIQFAASFEQGGINTSNGTFTADSKRIRSTIKIDLSQPLIKKYGYFGLYGNGYGALGSEITSNHYDVIFFKSDDTFVSASNTVQFFDEVEIPLGVAYARVVLHQSVVPSSKGVSINLRVPEFPKHVRVEQSEIHHCRRQGISICGGKHLHIKDCEIHHIAGTDPQGGIDIEDGYDLNQFIHIDGNDFHDNTGFDVVAVNGKYINITNNRLTTTTKYGSLGLNRGVDKAIVTGNTIHNALVNLEGEVLFTNNQLYGSHLRLAGDTQLPREICVSQCMFNNCLLTLDKSTPYQIKIDGCKFFNDIQKTNSFYNAKWCSVTFRNEPQIFSNCEFDGDDYYYLNNIINGTNGGWIYDNVTFKNIKKPLGLPGGTYTNCKFLGNVTLTLNGSSTKNGEYTLRECVFNANITVSNTNSFKLLNCYLQQQGGTVLKIQNAFDQVIIKGNVINYLNSVGVNSIIKIENTFVGNWIVIEDNIISSSINQIGIDNAILNNQKTQVNVRNNTLFHAVLKLNGNELNHFNVIDGVMNP
ncbi:right-handed parallel beta-helix repeat-containing protein [Paenibacillus frigoriresistens]|uniref:right-handed parallel beta-helix repeat-containing protein n=1 Tax=Paenibacillus alginolyticus TaxID=59839 RepID=UPI001563B012|nr:right-handed parallel beta-helix repeat-containing protein [Paenibacillus frigoriresistens]NRF90532.1 right-handed parallel beta-helix repeat-containing protein [Paenibacillus frigoriresistens]